MDTIEQLKQENDKLNARLAKAVEVFKEQKANIEAVTKERDELKVKYEDVFNTTKDLGLEIAQLKAQLHNQENIVDQDANIKELQNIIESKDQAYKVLQETYNNLFAENTKQKTELNQAITLYEEAKLEIDEVKQANNECIKENEDLKTKLEQHLQQIRVIENTTNEEVKKVTAIHDELITKYRDLENQLKAARDEITSLHGQLIKGEKDLQNMQKTCEEYMEAVEQQKKENKDAEEQFNKILNSYENDLAQAQMDKNDMTITINDLTKQLSTLVTNKTKYEEFTKIIIDLVESFNNNGNNIDNSTKIYDSQSKKTSKNSTGSQFMADAPGMNI